MKVLRVGIMSFEQMKDRTLSIARGERTRSDSEPRVWFSSVESFAKVLSSHNQALLQQIARERPESLAELEMISGRAKSNLSRTLNNMARYGLVELYRGERGRIVPRVPFDRIELDLPIAPAAA